MGFQQSTYDKALQAVGDGDLTTLKQVLSRPVAQAPGGRQARAIKKSVDRLTELIRRAAARGQIEAVDHLLGLFPALYRAEAQGAAWAHATEQGQAALAQHLWPAGMTRWSWYATAVEEGTLRAALGLLEQGYRPPRAAVSETLATLALREDSTRHPCAAPLVRHLIPMAGPEDLAVGARLAIRMGEDTLAEHCMNQADATSFRQWAHALREEALQADRYVWFDRVDTQLDFTRRMDDWVSTLNRALRIHRLRFVHAALNARPELAEYLHRDGQAAVNLIHTMMLATPFDLDGDPDEALRAEVFGQICRDTYVAWARSTFEDAHAGMLDPDMMNASLNALAWWAPASIQDAWVAEAPVTFAPILARRRAAQASSLAPLCDHEDQAGPSSRRARMRS